MIYTPNFSILIMKGKMFYIYKDSNGKELSRKEIRAVYELQE